MAKSSMVTAERPDDVEPEVWDDWITMRRAHRAPVTATALKRLRTQGALINLGLEQVMLECIDRNWRGFKAEWLMDQHQRDELKRREAIIASAQKRFKVIK
jgi:hypothetical protein